MAFFEYKITSREGKTSTGKGEAASSSAMIDSLVDGGYFVIEITEVAKPANSGTSISFGAIKRFFTGVASQKEMTYFYMQLSTLISAGVTLVESLESLADQCENPKFKAVVNDVKVRISTGQSFYEAVSKHPEVFDDLSANMIKAGETGAGLEEVLAQIAKVSERNARIKAKVGAAMVYPVILCILVTSVIFFLIAYVFPKFTKIFIKSKTALPLPTVILMAISNFIQAYMWHIVIFLIAAFFIGRWFISSSLKVRVFLDRAILSVPIFGEITLKSSIARFARTLGTLLNGGVPIIKSLEICEKIIENLVIKNVIAALKAGVAQGLTLHEILKTKRVFPSIVVKIIQTGERTGALPRLMLKIADFFEYEVEISTDGLVAIIEPVLIIVMGTAIGFIAIAMFLPMFDLTSAVK